METVLRKEIKYRISKIQFAQLECILSKELSRDSHGGDRGYLVRSLYFDSEYDQDLSDVLTGSYDKTKIRLRIYSRKDEKVKLEYKCKRGSDQIKYSLNITREQAQGMIRGEFGFLLDFQEPVARQIYLKLVMGGYRPKIMIEYQRIA